MNPLFTRNNTIVAGIIAVAVYGTAVIGTNYAGGILEHLSDIVQGKNTTTVASLNAPNWSFGIPLATPVETSVASSSYTNNTSGLASSTTYYFAVAALDDTGTTSVSNTLSFTTDASTTQHVPEQITVKWNAITGANAYAVFFSTTTTALNQYFLATSTNGTPNNQYVFATSTGSIAGTYSKPDTTAYAVKINPLGNSHIYNYDLMLGFPTTSPAATIDVASGTVRSYSVSTTTCGNTNRGAFFYNLNNDHLRLCQVAGWAVVK